MNNKVKKTLLIVAVVCLSLFLLFSFIAALATITTGKSLALFFTCLSVIFLLLIVNCVKSIKNNPGKNKKVMLIFYASLMVVAFACIPFFPETQTQEAIKEKSAIKSSDSDKEKTVDILENISEKTKEVKQENDTEIRKSNDDDSSVKIKASTVGDEVKPSNIYEIREELKNKYFVTEPAPFVLGDATGKWRISKIVSGYPTYEYAVKYAKAYMNNGDVYYIVNFQLKTTSMLHLLNGILEVKTTEYVKKEEHDAKKIGNGMLYTDQFFKLESGEELKTSGDKNAEKVENSELVSKVKEITKDRIGENEKITNIAFDGKNLTINVDISKANTKFVSFKDIALMRVSDITDPILELSDEYYNTWTTITVDFGSVGKAILNKNMVRNEGYGKFFKFPDSILK